MIGGLRQLMTRAANAVSALRGRPPEGRVFAWDRNLDSLRYAVTPRLTFARLSDIIQGGKDGDLAATLALYEEMEQRDVRLRSVAGTRRLALTGLDYEIVSAGDRLQDGADKTLADEAATYVRETLQRLDGFDAALKHLATAIGSNLAVAEIEWQGFEPIAIFPVPSHRLTMRLTQSNDVHIVTATERNGVPAIGAKFVVNVPESVSGSPLWKSVSEAQAWLWLLKKLALSDWGIFCEIFGMPVRVGKYKPGASPEEKTVLFDMLKNIGTSAWAAISEATSLEFVESSQRGIAPFEALLNFCNREMAVGYLGAPLPSDLPGGLGTTGAATEGAVVRGDIRDDDIKNESSYVGQQILRPICEFKFPGRDAAPPFFRRVKPETVDRIKEAQLFRAAQGAGATIPKAWGYKRLGIPEPQKGEDVLEPVDAFTDAVREGTPPAEG